MQQIYKEKQQKKLLQLQSDVEALLHQIQDLRHQQLISTGGYGFAKNTTMIRIQVKTPLLLLLLFLQEVELDN